jgi:hypothetical protein
MVRSYFVFVLPVRKKKAEPSANELYYWENGLMVFTEAYHLQRGYCCQSGCRHCPWKFKKGTKRARPD